MPVLYVIMNPGLSEDVWGEHIEIREAGQSQTPEEFGSEN